MSMQAMLLVAPGTTPAQPLRQTGLPLPVLGEGEMLLKAHACFMCRTDLHVVDGELPHPKLPIIPGHEVVGMVMVMLGVYLLPISH